MTSPRTFLEIRAGYPDDWEIEVLADAKSVCGDGDTLLHRAALRGRRQDVWDLVALGSDPNATGDMGNTALHYAGMSGHLQVALVLMEKGAAADLKNELGQSAADCARIAGHYQVEAVLRRSQK